MKREVKCERENTSVEIMLYVIFTVTGLFVFGLSSDKVLKLIDYLPYVFYALGIFSLVTYYLDYHKGNYEKLILSFINIIVGTFILINKDFENIAFIIGDGLLIFVIANAINKIYSVKKLWFTRDIIYLIKLSVTFVISIIGLLCTIYLYTKIDAGTIILGYFIIIYGLLSLLEPLTGIIFRNPKIENYFNKLLKYETNNNQVKKPTRIKQVAKTKLNIKERKIKKTNM